MKKLISLCCCVICFGVAGFAQSDSSGGKMMDKMDKMDKKMDNVVVMKDGKVEVMKAGMSMMLMHDTTIHGTMVMMDGNIKMKDGSMHMLKEGEYVTPKGKLMMPKMDGKMPDQKM
jgi:hypothetical protein